MNDGIEFVIDARLDGLKSLQAEILEKLDEAAEALDDVCLAAAEAGLEGFSDIRARAQAYWLPNIRSLVSAEEGNPYDHSIGSTIEEIQVEFLSARLSQESEAKGGD